MKGKIIKGIAGFYYVYSYEDGKIYTCHAVGKLRGNVKPLVGDDCSFNVVDEEKIEGSLTGIIKRKNELIRPAVSNVDLMMIIFAVTNPEPNFYLLDKFLFFIEHEGLSPILVFNKEDLNPEEADRIADIYKGIDAPIVFTSARENVRVDELKEIIKGKTVAVAGPSGVGKSTLINAIVGREIMETGEISVKTSRGKHTTRHTELFEYEYDNQVSFVLDTPGFTSLYLPKLSEGERVSDFYPEFADYTHKCRFNGCIHDKEPDCEVKKAVDAGLISSERYANYLKIVYELKNSIKY